ncbi:DUF2715 domain-containing protein [Treponema pedis]|nr:DUF2715 domain-containing protein [Treponema pedis]QOW61455.1 DUF2715 domain-containing protein [Treponema pedis]QSI03702.1 DUF2715 domain-containing protein [Treponema pedis]
MKKIIIVLLCIMFLCPSIFAKQKDDVIISVTQGYTNMSTILTTPLDLTVNDKLSSHNYNLGLTAGVILDNGFTFLEHTDFAAGVSYFNSIKSLSFLVELHSVIGYTFRPSQNAYINLLTGLGMIYGYPQIIQAGIPVQLGFQYYFTEKIGIDISAIDMIGIGFPMFLTNSFTIKTGISFRL